MTDSKCSLDGCGRPRKAKGFCASHYKRFTRTGSPGPASLTRPSDGMTTRQRLLSRAEQQAGASCLVWQGPVNDNGYGLMKVDGKMKSTHRLAYELEHGPIPEGMVVDHTCFVRNCVNVEHMRLATTAENNRSLSGTRKNGRGLPRGVTERGGRYLAAVRHDGNTLHLGTFDTPELAAEAASAKRAELWGEFAGAA